MSAAPSPQRIQHARAVLLQVKARLLADDPTLADDAKLMIDCLDSESDDALDVIRAMVRTCRDTEAKAIGAKAEADAYAEPLRERHERLANRARRIRSVLLTVCEAIQLPKWEDAAFTLSISKGSPGVVITDEAALPGQYLRVKRETDKLSILADLKAGKAVPGAVLSNAAPRITIRDR